MILTTNLAGLVCQRRSLCVMIIFRSGPLQVTRIDPSLVGKRTTRTVLVSTILTGAVCNWLATCLIVRRQFSKVIGFETDRALASACVLASVAVKTKMIFEDAFMPTNLLNATRPVGRG